MKIYDETPAPLTPERLAEAMHRGILRRAAAASAALRRDDRPVKRGAGSSGSAHQMRVYDDFD